VVTTWAVLAAGGSGTRFAGNKLLAEIDGCPVLARSAHALLASARVSALICVCPPEHQPIYTAILEGQLLNPADKPIHWAQSGENRACSVASGIARILPRIQGGEDKLGDVHRVLVHDAARPLLSVALIEALCQAMDDDETLDGVIPGLPVVDSLKKTNEDGVIQESVDRANLFRVQTPQLVHISAWQRAWQQCLAQDRAMDGLTDEAMVLAQGLAAPKIRVIAGDPFNLKITTHQDLALGELYYQRTHQQ
jgi:2-C-methyl-D-erythritol 4-phosphate cytidylyltransferase